MQTFARLLFVVVTAAVLAPVSLLAVGADRGGAGPGGGAGVSLPAFMPIGATADCGNDVRWYTAMPGRITTADSLWLRSHLTNNSHRRVWVEVTGEPVAELTTLVGEGQFSPPAVRKVLAAGPGLERVAHHRAPKPGESFYSFRVDLRRYFGKLKAGQYRVRVFLPADAYRMRGVPGYRPLELASDDLNFEVLEASLEAATKRLPPAYRLIERDGPPDPAGAGDLPTATLTNAGKEAWFIPYHEQRDDRGQVVKAKPPLHVPLRLLRWTGDDYGDLSQTDPADPPAHYDDRPDEHKMLMWRLEPGQSVQFVLPDWRTDGDGIYLYQVNLYVFNAEMKRQFNMDHHLLGQAWAEPFVIDTAADGE